MGSTEEKSINDSKTTQTTCIPQGGILYSTLTHHTKEIPRNGCF